MKWSRTNTNSTTGRVQPFLPRPPFLFTLDQIEMILQVDPVELRGKYLFFESRGVMARPPLDRIAVKNISPTQGEPEWRVSYDELERWFRRMGFRPEHDSFF